LLSQFKRAGNGHAAPLLAYDEETISLNTSRVAIDCVFLTNARNSTDVGTLRAAADAYRGEFASGLETGEPEFDERLEGER
ncbi:hypothetical protein, partial [Streptococcus pneumoniae]|uniref:hypothetical protein n=1 Tax=Streptococcus pneumoniae TaxID=1313 RepID=UPI001953262E